MADCAFRVWLVNGTDRIDLHDEAGGCFCEELNLGYPEVRDVVDNRADANGVDDRTQFFGARTVSASLKAVAAAGADIDAVAASFAPWMVPSLRPVLHYVLPDRPGTPERTITVRAAGYSWVVDNDAVRDIHLQWVAADPVIRSPSGASATAWAGASTGAGRRYNLTFNRTYPAGGGGPASATILSPGDVAVRPTLYIYGPVTAPAVQFSGGNGAIAFLSTFTLNTGQFVIVDCGARTAVIGGGGGSGTNVLTQMDWPTMYANGGWPLIPAHTQVTMTMTGQSTSGNTQTIAYWWDGYLS